jgi:ribose-phosphate pyrophosphokinase
VTDAWTLVDSDDYARTGIKTMTFPGGEPHAEVPQVDGNLLLHLKLRTWADVGFGALVVDAFSRQRSTRLRRLFIPYFPGARQDRSDAHTPLTVAVVARLFAPYGTSFRTCVFDPHSSVLQCVLPHMDALMPAALQHYRPREFVGVIAPDEGAKVRAQYFAAAFSHDHEAAVLQCTKKREFATGRITEFTMPPLAKPGRYIIVDDICDGGATFNLLAEAFAKDPLAATSELELFVSHGIFSKGLDNLSPTIGHITTTDSFCRLAPGPRLTVIPLLENLYPNALAGRA